MDNTTYLILPVLCITMFLFFALYFWLYGNSETKIDLHHDKPFERREYEHSMAHDIEEATKQRAVDYWANEWEMKKRGENHRD